MLRVKPPRCPDCGTEPTLCGTCGDYQCRCPLPWLINAKRKPRIMMRIHYDKSGYPYVARFIDGYYPEPEPTEEEDICWLIEGGFSP